MEGVLVQAVRVGAETFGSKLEQYEPTGVTMLSGSPRVRGFLLVNPHSGDDSPGDGDLLRAAAELDVEAHVLAEGEDLVQIARRADARILGIAGGDGSTMLARISDSIAGLLRPLPNGRHRGGTRACSCEVRNSSSSGTGRLRRTWR